MSDDRIHIRKLGNTLTMSLNGKVIISMYVDELFIEEMPACSSIEIAGKIVDRPSDFYGRKEDSE